VSVSPDIVIASAGSTLFGVRAAASAWQKSIDNAVTLSIITDHGHLLMQQALAGTWDVGMVMLPADMIRPLQDEGCLAPVEPVHLGSVCIGAAVSTATGRAGVADIPALTHALREASEIMLTLAPTGDHMMKVITGLGLLPVVESKIKRFDKSVAVNRYLVTAPAGALAFGPATEILAWSDRGVTWCGAIPPALQVVLPYEAAILKNARDKQNAQAFLAYLTTEESRECFAQSGVEYKR
jgi:hypothetical protein